MTPREHTVRLDDILEYIEKIGFAQEQLSKYEISNHPEAPKYGLMAFDAILYSLLVIGEAVKSLDPDMKARYQHIDWNEIIGLRDVLAHQYHLVEVAIIKGIVEEQLHEVRDACRIEIGE